MPDEWETAHGLNPNNAADRNTLDASGYTNLEVYINSLVADITSQQNADGTLTDGISAIISRPIVSPHHQYYTLQGREVTAPTRGIYIHDGKKRVIR